MASTAARLPILRSAKTSTTRSGEAGEPAPSEATAEARAARSALRSSSVATQCLPKRAATGSCAPGPPAAETSCGQGGQMMARSSKTSSGSCDDGTCSAR